MILPSFDLAGSMGGTSAQSQEFTQAARKSSFFRVSRDLDFRKDDLR